MEKKQNHEFDLLDVSKCSGSLTPLLGLCAMRFCTGEEKSSKFFVKNLYGSVDELVALHDFESSEETLREEELSDFWKAPRTVVWRMWYFAVIAGHAEWGWGFFWACKLAKDGSILEAELCWIQWASDPLKDRFGKTRGMRLMMKKTWPAGACGIWSLGNVSDFWWEVGIGSKGWR